MKINIKYSSKIINLPASVAKASNEASKEDLCIIINLFAYGDYFSSFENVIEEFSEKIGIGINNIKKSLLFWQSAGVLSVEDFDEVCDFSVAQNSVPTYTGSQISKFMESNKEVASLFYTCQTILGKEFNTYDHNNVIFLKNYYKFTDDYIMLLLAHCVENEKSGWSYIRKTAKNLYDDGIDTYKKLEKHFADRKNSATLEYKIRNILGIGERELIKIEKEAINTWIESKTDIELIKKAYEITVENTGKASIRYMSKIINNWIASGVKSVDDIPVQNKDDGWSSFDTNDFFEAALGRSYGKNKKGEEK